MNCELTLKVCGMRDPENIRAVEALGIQWMGFIFWPGSKRYVSERPSYLPTKCKRVGVFVDADISEVVQKVEEYALDLIQLHGSESPDYISQFKNLLAAHRPLSIIKAFNIATLADLEQTHAYENIVDYFLFDTKGKSVGGNGEQFDWQVLDHYHGPTPYLLSGGIGPDDVHRVRAFSHPLLAGIDLNSRFETSPGVKDIESLHRFLTQFTH
jgi:phosphoribosylanthranilate isomerase